MQVRLLVVERKAAIPALRRAFRDLGIVAVYADGPAERRYAARAAGDGLACLEVLLPEVDGRWLVYSLTHLALSLSYGWELYCDAVPTLTLRRPADAELDYPALLDRLLRLPTVGTIKYPILGITANN